ncbi:ATP-dependent helicase [Sporosarcina koreensis]|uniref:ATP-dependent helicase n=1 Tax=Sporosarcina koreensis TaxID=334735 RepID=UPI00075AFE1A|nr:ATP-dependent helicase [Sporosarcina koreensis]
MLNLTPKQQEIVEYLDGSLLVTAGPGSGKTRVLTQRIANIIEKRKGKVLALTFSNKAAEEISERVKEQIAEEDFERVEVGTIHSFCLDVVTNKGNQIGLPSGLALIENEKDKLELLKRSCDSLNLSLKERELREYYLQIQNFKQNFITPDLARKEQHNIDVINLYESYNNLLISNRVIDFDDILFYAYKVFVDRPRVAKNYTRLYRYILIDEAQDLNETQYKIIQALTRDFYNLMMVGDSAQSIYGFNGSDSDIMTKKFVKDFEPKEFILKENFRSTYKIIDAANRIQPHSKSQSVYPLEGVLEVHSFADEEEEANWITSQIEYLIENGSPWVENEIELEDIAIIGRNRYLFDSLEKCLQKKKLSYSFGGSNVHLECETIEMKIFETGLRVLVNPHDDLNYSKVNSYLSRENQTENFLQDLLSNREINNLELNDEIVNAIINAWNILDKDGSDFMVALNEIEKTYLSLCQLEENFQFLIQNDLELWKERWSKYCKQSVPGGRSLPYFRNQVSLGKFREDNNEGVSLLTVHTSKGLEYEIVFVLGLTQGTFPDYRAKTHSQKIEEKNNMFVAITRAKRECYLTYPLIKVMPWGDVKRQQPSEYLLFID